jgi:hypothetical protein
LFKENGSLLYSTDEFMTTHKNTVSLFEALDAIVYAFVIGVPRTIIVQNNERCLIIKPIYVEDYGVVEAWLFALGDCRTLSCDWISDELVNQCKSNMKKDISATLETERIKSILRRSFDFPRILGHEIDFENGSMIVLDGDDGIVALSHGGLPWGIETHGGRLYPDVITGLEELDMKMQEEAPIGVFIPPTPKYVRVKVKNSDYSKSNKLLLLILVYSIILIASNPPLIWIFVFTDIMIVFFLLFSRTENIDWCDGIWSASSFIAGFFVLLVIIYSLQEQVVISPTWFFLGPFAIMMGIMFILNILGREEYENRLPDKTKDAQPLESDS